jgi:hypothetical protein
LICTRRITHDALPPEADVNIGRKRMRI